MSKATIQNPKVFLSYAWGSEEYQSRVLAFAVSLVNDGIDVVFDKWSLAEGNDTFAFMEKCVNDPSITSVLMLLDPIYAQKADAHEGGVGTETQIISPKVYANAEQSKFIPIVFERNSDGDVCKPTYLQGRLHFDLSLAEKYHPEYQRLVKRLYGIEVYEKPDIGSPPKWLTEPVGKSILIPNRYDILRTNTSSRIQGEQFANFLNDIQNAIVEYTHGQDVTDILELYAQMRPLRDDYLHLLRNYAYVENSEDAISIFLEDTYNRISYTDQVGFLKQLLLHELFIYTVAFFLKQKDYISAGRLLGKTYFNNSENGTAQSFTMFYCSNQSTFDNAINNRDNKKYLSGVAKYWTESIDTSLISQSDFVFGDLICYSVSALGQMIHGSWYWFPLTYVYDNRYSSCIRPFAQKLVSREQAEKVLPLFGCESIEQLKASFSDMTQKMQVGEFRVYRYPSAFDPAPLLCEYINSAEIGTLR